MKTPHAPARSKLDSSYFGWDDKLRIVADNVLDFLIVLLVYAVLGISKLGLAAKRRWASMFDGDLTPRQLITAIVVIAALAGSVLWFAEWQTRRVIERHPMRLAR